MMGSLSGKGEGSTEGFDGRVSKLVQAAGPSVRQIG